MDPMTTPRTKARKRAQYLCDADRRNIILRIDNGEKQAALAREYGVTRAAISHIKKNRDEVLHRYQRLVQSVQELHAQEDEAMATERRIPQSQSMWVLMTRLRDITTPPREFRNAANRIMTILLEEAIAKSDLRSIQVTTASMRMQSGLARQQQCCGVAFTERGAPLLEIFQQLEPDEAIGTISLAANHTSIERMDLPHNIQEMFVLLLLPMATKATALLQAIQALAAAGVRDAQLCIVSIVLATDVVDALGTKYQHLTIVAAAMDDLDRASCQLTPGVGDFYARYNMAWQTHDAYSTPTTYDR